MAFKSGQYVRMLVASEGCDAEDVERTYPPGVAGFIDDIDERGVHHVAVGQGDLTITVCFDAGEEAERSMQAISTPRIHAEPVAFSSVVGSSVMLTDPTGACIGLLGLRQVAGGRAEMEAMAVRIADAINYAQGEHRIHHPKRGSDYDVVASHALFQVSAPSMGDGKTPFKPRCRIVEDGAPVTVYRNHHGTFVRFPDEIARPRFEEA